MFCVGEAVVYGVQGVCRIREMCTKKFGKEEQEYFVLCPIFDEKSVIYVPTDKPALLAQMRSVLTKEELRELIASAGEQDAQWIENDSHRRDFCTEVIKSGDRSALMQLVSMLYLHSEELKGQKKHFHIADERSLKQAKKLLHDEFAFVLGITPEEVPEYISRHI